MRLKQTGIAGSTEQRQRELVAVCGVLSAILAVEHRAVQPHLAHIWQLLWLAAQGEQPHLQKAAVLVKTMMLLLVLTSGLLFLCSVTTRVVLSAMQSGLHSAHLSTDLAEGLLLTLLPDDSLLFVALKVQLHASCHYLLVPIIGQLAICLYIHRFLL